METRKPHVPVTVSTGVLTQTEYAQLSAQDRKDVDESMAELLGRYGQAWLQKERGRLRDELSFTIGTP